MVLAPDEDGSSGPVRFPLVALIARYAAHRTRRRTLSSKTAHEVERSLRRFAQHAPADIRRVNRRHIETWLDQPQYSASTRRRMLSELHVFFKWAIIEGHAKRDPTLEVDPIRQPPTVPGALSQDQADVVHTRYLQLPPRERLMISLNINEALRRVELARLQVSDIDRRGRTARVRGKARGGLGDITGMVPLSDETMRNLLAYLDSEPTVLGIDKLASGPLFRNRWRPNTGLTADRIGRLVADALREIGVKQAANDGVSGHALRHTAATEALEAGVPIEKVQRMLRHKFSKTTDHYTRGAVFDLREFHDRRKEARGDDNIIDLTD